MAILLSVKNDYRRFLGVRVKNLQTGQTTLFLGVRVKIKTCNWTNYPINPFFRKFSAYKGVGISM